ncbi:MAG: LSU ribosomal protein L25p [uncultured Gemmatimonadaceae bacterium]|uniref:Large ribosomal subunit protein bL25 n=1 Tax=uncultured Gemmatimonadaceae bacterium TaxID=246130 RepID=A0A6J4L077_9BACT|nr:MAG: LSU ribosomal protein L25p [uncultured Gemmatimonadaceae bacterium]
MATPATLTATARAETGKGVARKLRAAGEVPAVIYGHNRAPQSLAINARDLDRLLARISAANTVVELSLGNGTSRTLIREIQRHPFKRQVLHVDFQELVAGETVTVQVPLILVGTADGVRNGGGVLDQVLYSLEIECDPAAMPNHIDVDVSAVGVGESLHVRDLTLPQGITVLNDPDAGVLTVQLSRAAIEDAAAAAAPAADASGEPEVIRAKKDDEE